MRKDKIQAEKLRLMGKTYEEISRVLAIPKSTLSDWFRDQKWSNDIAIKNANEQRKLARIQIQRLSAIRGEHLKKLYEQAEREASEDFELLKYHPLFVSGLMIYWGEGDKTSKYRVSIANTEAKMINIFKLFLKNICGFPNPRCWLLLYPDLSENECKNFWMEACNLEMRDFTKTMVIQGRSKTKRLSHGVCNLGVSSAYLKSKILKWIELLSTEISNERYIAGMV